MTLADLELALDWAAAEGWNPGLDDAAAFHLADPDGFLMGFLDGEPVACISVVNYGDSFAFLGLYICRAEFRGRGFGWALWQAGLAHAGDRTIGLDGIIAQQANYAKSGFTLAHHTIRYVGVASTSEIGDARIVELRRARPGGLAGAVAAYDEAFFPGPRSGFLRGWIMPPGRRTVVWVEENKVRGYGSVRACRAGNKIGPLFADTETIADRLFGALTARLRGSLVSVDVPQPNGTATALAKHNGLAPVFETARMSRGKSPFPPLDRIWGITTLELG
jgi:Acetyltransferase (GNAT) domain/Acetyltransferase (GNAT) family